MKIVIRGKEFDVDPQDVQVIDDERVNDDFSDVVKLIAEERRRRPKDKEAEL